MSLSPVSGCSPSTTSKDKTGLSVIRFSAATSSEYPLAIVTTKNLRCFCRNPEDADEIYAWILEQFEASYKDSKTPVVLLLNSAWFQYNSGALEAAERLVLH